MFQNIPKQYGSKFRRRKTSKEERICDFCGHQFKKAEHLARHVRTHSKEKPFHCSVCQKAFVRQDTLLRHARSHAMNVNFDSTGIDRMSVEDSETHPSIPMVDSGSIEGDITTLMSPPDSSSVDRRTPNVCGETIYPSHVSPLASFFPMNGNAWKSQCPPPPIWDHVDNSEWGALLTGDNFDLDAVNLSLLCATSSYPTRNGMLEVGTVQASQLPSAIVSDSAKWPSDTIKEKWHTFSEICHSGQLTPVGPSENSFIDESCRKRLAEGLQPRVQHGILPSSTFLNLCLQAYFSKFHPLFPIVHIPTFRPGIHNSILLLSICSAGSLIVGSQSALSHGISMYERLNKATLSSWDTFMTRSGTSSLIALQASMLGQTVGLLLGRPRDLTGIDIFHGAMIAWARKAKLFNPPRLEYNPLDVTGEALEDMWRSWIQEEIKKRITFGLHTHDAWLAKLHNHDPILRHSPDRVPQLSSNELFTAPSANHWRSLMISSSAEKSDLSLTQNSPHNSTSQVTTPPGDFELCGMLECIGTIACEEREQCNELDSPSSRTSRCHLLLKKWYTEYQPTMTGKSSWFSHMTLWHSTFMTLYTNFNSLECALGREGHDVSQAHLPYARTWVRSTNAKRCLLHAMLIQKNFESLPTGAEPGFHVPMCLYYSGLVWSSFVL